MNKISFFKKIRTRFVLSFVAVVVVLTLSAMLIIAGDFKNIIDRGAKNSLQTLSESIFQTLFVSMSFGDNEIVQHTLADLKTKNIVDELELYISDEVIELFSLTVDQSKPAVIKEVFRTNEEKYIEGKERLRYIKPIRAKQECLSCHINAGIDTVLGVMDLEFSLVEFRELAFISVSKIVATILALVLISGMILHIISKRILFDPLEELRVATIKLGKVSGKLDVKIMFRGVGEFADIAKHFNRFISRVRGMNNRLTREQEKIKEILEAQDETIKTRTQEVRKLNSDMQTYIEIIDENVITSRTDTKGIIIYASEAFCEISGYTKEEIVGKPHNVVRHKDMPKEVFADLWATIKSGKSWQGEVKNAKKNGGFYWVKVKITPIVDENGDIYEYMATRQDITLQKELEDTLDKLTEMTQKSRTDNLTGLLNRARINELLDIEINRSERYKNPFCVVLLDIDHFKKINDTYGHLVGDDVLRSIASLLSNKTRKSDIVSRWGGEEFLILLTNVEMDMAYKKVELIREIVSKHDFGEAGTVTASFGISEYQQGDNIESLVNRADVALYTAKEMGRNRVEKAVVKKEDDD